MFGVKLLFAFLMDKLFCLVWRLGAGGKTVGIDCRLIWPCTSLGVKVFRDNAMENVTTEKMGDFVFCVWRKIQWVGKSSRQVNSFFFWYNEFILVYSPEKGLDQKICPF